MSDLIKYSPEERQFGERLLAAVHAGKVINAVAIAWFCGPEKRYKMKGYSTEAEFVEEQIGLSYRMGKRYKQIGQAFFEAFPLQLALPAHENGTLSPTAENGTLSPILEENPNLFDKLGEFINEIGVYKLLELTRYDVDLKELSNDDKVTLKDGSQLSLEDIKMQTARQLTLRLSSTEEEVEELRYKVKADKARHEEEMKLLKAERDAYAERLEEAKELERLYGGKAGQFTDKKKMLDYAAEYFDLFRSYLGKADVLMDDPMPLQERIAEIVRLLNRESKRYTDMYSFAGQSLDDLYDHTPLRPILDEQVYEPEVRDVE